RRSSTSPIRRSARRAQKRSHRGSLSALLLREHEVLGHPRLHVRQEIAVLEEPAVVVAVLPALRLALEVVVAGRAFLIAAGLAAMPDDFLHPPLLRVGSGIDRLIAIAANVIDARRDMVSL